MMTQPNTFTYAKLLRDGPAFLYYYRGNDVEREYVTLSLLSEADADQWRKTYYGDSGYIRMTAEEVHTWEFACRLRGE